jgi:RNA polymerase sigma-70 factor (ECF subfamily)
MPETESDDTLELIRRFKSGDELAFQTLFLPHVPGLRSRVARVLSGRIRRRISIADVLQEAGMAAFRDRESFEGRGEGAFRHWLLGIVDHKIQDQLRRHGGAGVRAAAREITRAERPSTDAFPAEVMSPSVAAARSELTERIRRAMAELPEDYREVLQLALERGLLLREVAERIGRSREATKKLYGRALCRLKAVVDGGHRG